MENNSRLHHIKNLQHANLDNILANKLSFLDNLKNKQPLPEKFDALIVIDQQKEYCRINKLRDMILADRRGNQDTEVTAEHTANVIKAFRDAALPIYAVYSADEPRSPWRIDFYKYKHDSRDTLIYKKTNSAFKTGDNGLDDELTGKNHKHLLIVGFNTNACVRETVNDAQTKGYQCWLMLDCTANDSWNNPDNRDASLNEMRKNGAEFTTSLNSYLQHTRPLI